MAKKTIMLVCAAGMSTSMLVKKMEDAAAKEGVDAKIFATSTADAHDKLDSENPDVLMLGPQVRYLEGEFKKDLSIPVEVINMQDYGLLLVTWSGRFEKLPFLVAMAAMPSTMPKRLVPMSSLPAMFTITRLMICWQRIYL